MAAAQRKEIDLGYVPRPWQQEIGTKLKRFSVLIVHRRGGKTVIALWTLIGAALRNTTGNGRYAYIAPQLKQAKGISFDYLKSFTRPIPGVKVNESELSIELPNGSKIRLYGADSPDNLRGNYFDGAVCDEIAQMNPIVWGEILRPCLADRGGFCLFIGTPKGINLLSKLYFNALKKKEGYEDWYAGSYTWSQTGALSDKEIADMRNTMSANEWRQEMECDFSAATENTLISMETVDAAQSRTLQPKDFDFAPKIIGVDVARYGGDRSVIFCRQGSMVFPPQVFDSIDNMTLAGMVAKTIDKFRPDAVFIDAGRGEGVIDRLLQLGYSPVPVNFGGKPMAVKYVNKRAEMWSDMAAALETACIPNMAELRQDLCTPTYSYANAAGKFELESKDSIKKRGLTSPDLGDALAITYAWPVAPASMSYKPASCAVDYDPIATPDASTMKVDHKTEYDIFNDSGPTFGL